MSRALVLGGGGPVGIAWESGLLAGLAEGGVDVSPADYVVGTSAGSFVGAQLAGGKSPAAIAAPDLAGAFQPSGTPEALPNLIPLIAKMMEALSGKRPQQDVLKEIGEMALASPAMSEEEFIGRFQPALGPAWPDRFACTAVDTADGSFTVWNKDSGIELARGVASSCAVPMVYPPISIGGRRYMDGGMRSGVNADLAAAHDKVLVVVVGLRAAPPPVKELFGGVLDKQLASLKHAVVIAPDDDASAAMGTNLMDPSARQAAARAGLVQGRLEAARLAEFWN